MEIVRLGISMSFRRQKAKFQHLTKFKRGKLIGLLEGVFSCRATGARVQRKICTEMEADEVQTNQKSGNE